MRKWVFYSALATAGFVLPVANVHVAAAEASEKDPAASDGMGATTAPEAGTGMDMPSTEPAPAPSAVPSEPRTPSDVQADKKKEMAPETPQVSAPSPAATEATEEYVVQEGDTLGDIAREHLGSVDAWRRIARLNGIDDPARLSVGTRLKLPAKEERGG